MFRIPASHPYAPAEKTDRLQMGCPNSVRFFLAAKDFRIPCGGSRRRELLDRGNGIVHSRRNGAKLP